MSPPFRSGGPVEGFMRGPTVLLVLLFGTGIGTAWAQTGDPWIGNWELNVAASRWSPGPGVRRESSIIEAWGDGLLMITTGVSADGREFRRELRGRFDGKEYPVEGAAQPTMRSLRRIGVNTFEYVTKVGGGVTRTVTTVSADGRTRTSVTTGTNGRGEKVHDVQLRERR